VQFDCNICAKKLSNEARNEC